MEFRKVGETSENDEKRDLIEKECFRLFKRHLHKSWKTAIKPMVACLVYTSNVSV